MARNSRTGIYVDNVNLIDGAIPWAMGGADMTGLGLAFECVAQALGWQSMIEAQDRVLLTLRSLAGKTPGFNITRNRDGWLPRFFDSNTGSYTGSSWA